METNRCIWRIGARAYTHTWLGVLAATALVVASLALWAPPASAQAENCQPADPYTGGVVCPREVTVDLSIDEGAVGVLVDVEAQGFVVGDEVVGYFDGFEVFRVRATADPDDPSMGVITANFRVPQRTAGSYGVCVAGSGGQACPAFRVLGAEVTRSASNGTSGGGGIVNRAQAFARTGADTAILVAVALALIVAGWLLRRRRHAA